MTIRKLYLLLLILPLAFVGRPSLAQQKETKTAADIRQLKAKTRNALDSLDKEQERLKEDAGKLKKSEEAEFKKEMAAIKREEVNLREKVKEETRVADEKWESFKTTVEKEFNDLKKRVERAKDKLKKQIPDNSQQPAERNVPEPPTLLT
ncbi:hypothetical protein [Chitinophaga flava]|uniref:Peptidase M23 n=1 Tax=Chitinophaga flava TaxID=2259036 RepID=A0A365Y0D6_9BACT|nr:hypothetical protein [Chitinophaga flava]RBL91394.1 hypothetical protein DF182_01880 [Chitinophaga flava]